MARRYGPVHVATVKKKHDGKVYESVLLRRTFRDGGKVKHETLGNISHLPAPVIELVRGALRGEQFVPINEAFEVVRNLPYGHIAAVLGTLRKIGLDELVSSRPDPQLDIVIAIIVARIIAPESKLATARGMQEETASNCLGEILNLQGIDEDDLYEAMDWLLKRQSRIEKKLADKHLEEGTLILYDVSTSYYTGKCCPLAQRGNDKDGKGKFPVIAYGLLCNRAGCPISIQAFEGNTGDPATFASQVEKVRERFGLKRIVFVGDRGMITEKRINEDLRGIEGLDWITALRAPTIKNLADAGTVQLSLFDDRDLAEVTSPDFPGERLIACRNPFLADERKRKRDELLAATEKEFQKIANAVQRKKKPLRGAAKIGVRVGKVKDKYKMAKHFELTITDTEFSFCRKEEKISEEASLDGIYVIRTSVPQEALDSEDTVRAYKDLSAVEHAFRSIKTVDLKVRPIYHRNPDRVRAHLFLCMLAYYVEWHMRAKLAPILFDDEDGEIAKATRTSPVQHAEPSKKAKSKAASKETEDGYPVSSFQSLLDHLATLNNNRVRLKRDANNPNLSFHTLTIPTPLQHRAFELLEVPIKVA